MTYFYKGSKIQAPLTITSNEPVYETLSVGMSTQRASQNAQRWELSFAVTGHGGNEADMMLASITDMDTVGTMVMPQLPSVVRSNTISNLRSISASAAIGDDVVYINSDGVLSKGTFIKFGNHDKLYMVTTTTTTSGTVEVGIYPSLRSTITTANAIKTGSSVLLSYYRDVSNVRGITFEDGVISNPGLISLVEAI